MAQDLPMSDRPSERRADPQAEHRYQIRWREGDGNDVTSRKIRDLSRGGVFVETDQAPDIFAEITFSLLDPAGHEAVTGLARVVWLLPDAGMGLQFLSLTRGEDALSRMMSDSSADAADAADADSATRPSAAHTAARIAPDEVPTAITIGVDLGTTNTCASAVVDGKPVVLPTRYGTNTIPSVINLSDDGSLLVGDLAARRAVQYPHLTVYGSKRLLGCTYRRDIAEEFQPHFAFPLVESEDHQFAARIGDQTYSMTDVATEILKEVKGVAEAHLCRPIERVVVTVPAYFNERQREEVRKAAATAGLDVASLVPEPTAAAIAYGHNQSGQKRLAVIDLGGGTFDISILDISENRFRVIATGGDPFLGGIDFDDRLAAHLLDEFSKKHRVRIEPTAQQLARLREAAEEAKRNLSVQSRTTVHLPQFAPVGDVPTDLSLIVDQDTLNLLSADLLDRISKIVEDTFASINMDPLAIDDALLVGGSTRILAVANRIEALFQKRPSKRINADEAVAIGAALLAQASDVESSLELVDALPLSIGFANRGRAFDRVIPRNTAIPATRKFTLATYVDDQSEYAIPLFQGDKGDVARNEYLGTAVIENIPPGPVGAHRFQLTLSLSGQGTLSIRATDEKSGVEIPVLFDRDQTAEQVIAGLGPYRGPELPKEPKRRSALGKFFRKITSLLE